MYPCLIVAGGFVTLAWDNRYFALTTRFHSRRSPSTRGRTAQAQPDVQLQEDLEAIELSNLPITQPTSVSNDDKGNNEVPTNISTTITMPEIAHSVSNGPSLRASRACPSHSSLS